MIKNTELLKYTKYINLFSREYEMDGEVHNWNVASRRENPLNLEKKETKEGVDAVLMAGFMFDADVTRLCVVEEYRPAIGGTTLGLPAGLVDDGESLEDAAIREMKEETGLEFRPMYTSPRLFSSPGMTDECSCVVFGQVEGKISDEFQEKKENIVASLLTPDDLKTRMTEKEWNYEAKAWFVFKNFIRNKNKMGW